MAYNIQHAACNIQQATWRVPGSTGPTAWQDSVQLLPNTTSGPSLPACRGKDPPSASPTALQMTTGCAVERLCPQMRWRTCRGRRTDDRNDRVQLSCSGCARVVMAIAAVERNNVRSLPWVVHFNFQHAGPAPRMLDTHAVSEALQSIVLFLVLNPTNKRPSSHCEHAGGAFTPSYVFRLVRNFADK